MANKFCIISLIVLFHINVIYLTLLGKKLTKKFYLIFLCIKIYFLASVMIVYYTEVYKTANTTCLSSANAKLMIQGFKSCHSNIDCEQNFTRGACLNGNCVF